MIGFGATDVGRHREINQDCFTCCQLTENIFYAVVCDGMGGENGGQVASSLALSSASQAIEQLAVQAQNTVQLREVISQAVARANTEVNQRAKADSRLSGMGTTMIVLVAVGNMVCIGYAGDSRAYLYSPESDVLTQITRDHTVVQMLMDNGEITPEEMLTHPQRHYITRAVGVEPEIEITFREHLMESGQCLLLCSDGLYNYVSQEALPGLIMRAYSERSADCLIEAANVGGGGDNITAVVISPELTEEHTDG